MDIYYKNSKLQKSCNAEKESVKRWGARQAALIRRRLAELQAADCLADISYLPPPRLHQLSNDRKGQLAVDTLHPARLIFKPNHDPIPQKDDGGLDLTQITQILIIEVEDYHGK